MTPLERPVRRVTTTTYGYGRNARKLVVILQKGDLITIREKGRRVSYTTRLYDVFWWLLRCEPDRARMENSVSARRAELHGSQIAASAPQRDGSFATTGT